MSDRNTASAASGRLAFLLTLATSLAGFVMATTLAPAIAGGQAARLALPWAPSLGVELSFLLDGLSLLFVLLICGTGFFVTLYAGAYMRGHPQRGRFFVYLLFFEVAMLGLVTADDLIGIYVFWELTTVSS